MTKCGLLGRHANGTCIAEDAKAAERAEGLAALAASAYDLRASPATTDEAATASPVKRSSLLIPVVAGVVAFVAIVAVIAVVVLVRRRAPAAGEDGKSVRTTSAATAPCRITD